MSKEELLKFIDSIKFEVATNLELTYFKKKPTNDVYTIESDKYDMERKTITFNKDFEGLLNERTNWIDRRIDDLYSGFRDLEQKINKEG